MYQWICLSVRERERESVLKVVVASLHAVQNALEDKIASSALEGNWKGISNDKDCNTYIDKWSAIL